MELCSSLSELIALEMELLDTVHHMMHTDSSLVLFVLNSLFQQNSYQKLLELHNIL